MALCYPAAPVGAEAAGRWLFRERIHRVAGVGSCQERGDRVEWPVVSLPHRSQSRSDSDTEGIGLSLAIASRAITTSGVDIFLPMCRRLTPPVG